MAMVETGKDITMTEMADHVTIDHTTAGEKRETLISSARGTVNKLGATAEDLSHQVRRLSRVALVLLVFTVALVVITIALEVQVSQRNKTIREVQSTVATTAAIINAVTGNPEQLRTSVQAQAESRAAIARTEAKVNAIIATLNTSTTTTSP